MARRGRLQPIQCLGRDADRGVKADGKFGQRHIVVDGFRDTDKRQPSQFHQAVQNLHRAVTADADQAVQAQTVDRLDDGSRPILYRAVRHWIAERVPFRDRPQHRAAAAQHLTRKNVEGQRHRPWRLGQQSFSAVQNTDDLGTKAVHGPFDHGADRGVQAGTIATTG